MPTATDPTPSTSAASRPSDTTGSASASTVVASTTGPVHSFWQLHGEPLLHLNEKFDLISQFDVADTVIAARVISVADAPAGIPGHSQLTIEDRSGKRHTLLLSRTQVPIEDVRAVQPDGWQAWVLKSGPSALPGDSSTAHCVSYRFCAFEATGGGFLSLMGDNREIQANPQISQLVSAKSVDDLAATLPKLRGWDWSVVSTHSAPPVTTG